MGNDQAIEYNTILSQLELVLERFKNASIDVSKYEKEIEAIKSTCEEELKEYDLHDSNNEFSGIIEAPFINAIGKLKRILSELKSNEIYVKIHVLAERIKAFAKSDNKDEETFKIYRNSLIAFLTDFKNSQTLPIHLEMKFVMEIYSAAYLLIKKEIKTFNRSTTLDILSKDVTHLANLNTEISRELKSQNLDSRNNRAVKNKKQEIESDGAMVNYATPDFIKLIVLAEESEISISNRIKSVTSGITNYKGTLEHKLNSLDSASANLKINCRDINNLKKLMQQNLALFLSSTALLILMPVSGFFLSRDFAKYPLYGVEEITYDEAGTLVSNKTNYYQEERILKGLFLRSYTKFYRAQSNENYRQFIELLPIPENLDISTLSKEEIYTFIRETEAVKTTYDFTIDIEGLTNRAYYEIVRYSPLENITKDKVDWLKFSLYFAISLITTILMEIAFRKSIKNYDLSTLFKALKKNRELRTRLISLQSAKGAYKSEISEIEKELQALVAANRDKITEAYHTIEELKDDIRFTELLDSLKVENKKAESMETRVLKKD